MSNRSRSRRQSGMGGTGRQSGYRRESSPSQQASPAVGPGFKLRLMIAGAIVLFSLISFLNTNQVNPITGKSERVSLSVNEEIQLGVSYRSQMGRLSGDREAQDRLNWLGERLVQTLENHAAAQNGINPYRFEFHLLADRQQVNAFALPGGQIFITEGLFRQLPYDDQVAAVLAHEMGHVIERHGAKQMTKQGLIQGVTGAAGVLGGDANSSRTAAAIGNMVTMRYSREAEFEADNWAVDLCKMARYDPQAMISVLELLKQVSGGASPPEFFSTHPSSDNRIDNIRRRLGIEGSHSNNSNRNIPQQPQTRPNFRLN